MNEKMPPYLSERPDCPDDMRDWLRAQLTQGVDAIPPDVRKFLEALSWRQRSVVCLLFCDALTLAQVSWMLGIAPRTVSEDLHNVIVLARGVLK
jgi:DNA-directed RNA polymerase specialized sigma24 family protein